MIPGVVAFYVPWLLLQSRALAMYWLVFFTCANVFVMGYEEPILRDRFGKSYETYKQHVGRWIPRLRGWSG